MLYIIECWVYDNDFFLVIEICIHYILIDEHYNIGYRYVSILWWLLKSLEKLIGLFKGKLPQITHL